MRYESITRKKPRKQQGQALIEYALVTPLILFVSLGIIDFGRALFSYAQASFQMRTALRIGAVTETGSGGDAFRDCSALATEVKKTLFIPDSDHSLKIRFIKQTEVTPPPQTPSNPGYITCFDDTLSPKVPGSWATDQDSIRQGDIIEISDDINVRLINPFFPEVLSFSMMGRRTVVTAITLSSAPGDSDFDGLDDQWECTHFGSVGLICDENDANFDPDAFRVMLQGQNATNDPDSDGCNNGCEEGRAGDPNDNDTDGDTLLDGEEAYTYYTDLSLPDTDGDSDLHSSEDEYTIGGCRMEDGDEVALGTNPLARDTDLDGPDDWVEVCQLGTDPLSAPTIAAPTLAYDPGGSNCDPVAEPLEGARYIGLAWDTLTDVMGYEVFIDGVLAATITDPSTPACGGSRAACTSLFPDPPGWNALATYDYQVRGYFGSVYGPFSNTVNMNCSIP